MVFMDICTNSDILKVIYFIFQLLKIVYFFIPIILILMVSVDFLKNVISNNEDEIKKNIKLVFNRLKFAVFLFLVPTVVSLLFNILEGADIKYINCFTNATLENIEYYQLLEEQSLEEELVNYSDSQKVKVPKKIDNSNQDSDDVNVYFLNVGNGDCIIVENNNKFGMIDTGYVSTSKSVVKFMKKLKIKQLEFLIITHNHADHVGGFNRINDNFKIKKLYIKKAGVAAKDIKGMRAYNSIVKKANKAGTTVKDVASSSNASFKLGNIKFKFYNRTGFKTYSKDTVHGDNANSIATLARVNGLRIYFAGDIGDYFGGTAETSVSKKIGKVDIYKASHHGYVSYNNSEFVLKKLSPTYVIFTTGDKSISKIALKRIKKVSSNFKKAYYTEDGTVKMQIDGNGKVSFVQY